MLVLMTIWYNSEKARVRQRMSVDNGEETYKIGNCSNT